ncbi:hypothetical protein [Lacrimispora amygdalina]|uniref:hypothetical protein n=1 Tax=Lacrimispora amygdalina TaxID=253257 RepID=UPI000BE2F62A|nr:hypothetical protein [Lacrimispora amygdalina]
MDIKLLNDETRFYIVLENPSDEEKLKAIDLVSSIFGIKKKEEKPEGVIPARVEDTKIPDEENSIMLKGESNRIGVTEPLKDKEDTNKGKAASRWVPPITSPEMFVKEYLSYNTLDEKSQKWVIINCSRYMKRYLATLDSDNSDVIRNFINDFSPVLENTITQFLKNNGYSNLKGFLSRAEETEIKAMYEACKLSVCRGLNIK